MHSPRDHRRLALLALGIVLVVLAANGGHALAQNASETGGGNRAPAGGAGISPLLRSWVAGPREYGGRKNGNSGARTHHGSARRGGASARGGSHGRPLGHGSPPKTGTHHYGSAAGQAPNGN